MATDHWKDVAASQDIQDGSFLSVELGEDERVLLVRSGGTLRAWADSCPHVGCPLSNGDLADGVLTCPCHNARFDALTGAMLSPPSLDDLARYELSERDGRVLIGPRHEPEFARAAGPTAAHEHATAGADGIRGGADNRTVAIVGAGAGGAMAAEQLRRDGFAGRIVMITPEPGRPYDRVLLSKFYLAGEMEFERIALRPESFYEDHRIELWTGRSVTSLDPESRTLTLENGSRLAADAVVLATGSRAKPLPVPGAELGGVHLLRSAADAETLRADARAAKNAVVIGASFIGTEAAAYLKARGLEVAITAPESVPFERTFGHEVGARFASMHRSAGVQLHLGRSVSRITGSDRVREVELSDGSTLPADLVVIGVGAEPVLEYLEGSGLVQGNAVPVDARMRTAAEGVYAVGDIALVHATEGAAGADGAAPVADGAGGEARRVEHWVVAQRHGMQAARSILAPETKPLNFAPFFWTRQFETSFGYIGHAPEFDEVRFTGDVEAGQFLAGYFRDGVLAAVGTIGRGVAAAHYGRLLEAGRRIGVDEFEHGQTRPGS